MCKSKQFIRRDCESNEWQRNDAQQMFCDEIVFFFTKAVKWIRQEPLFIGSFLSLLIEMFTTTEPIGHLRMFQYECKLLPNKFV